MEHASFIIGSWVLTTVAVAVYAGWIIKRGRDLVRQSSDKDFPWT